MKVEALYREALRPVLLPLGLIVVLDYAALLGRLAQIALVAYLTAQVLAVVAGAGLHAVAHLKPDHFTAGVWRIRLARHLPGLRWGKALLEWALAEEVACSSPSPSATGVTSSPGESP